MSREITTIVFTPEEVQQIELQRELAYKELAIKHIEAQGRSAYDVGAGPILSEVLFVEDLVTGDIEHEVVQVGIQIWPLTEEQKAQDREIGNILSILEGLEDYVASGGEEGFECCGQEECVHDDNS